jgi:DNA-directed RNA polymerase subunit F
MTNYDMDEFRRREEAENREKKRRLEDATFENESRSTEYADKYAQQEADKLAFQKYKEETRDIRKLEEKIHKKIKSIFDEYKYKHYKE